MAKTVGLTAAAGVELMLSAQRPRGGALHCSSFDISLTALCTESEDKIQSLRLYWQACTSLQRRRCTNLYCRHSLSKALVSRRKVCTPPHEILDVVVCATREI